MKVLHITYTTSGGAGIAVLRLHEALLAQGVESKILVGQTDIVSDCIVKITETKRGRYKVPNVPIINQAIRSLRRRGKCMTRMEKMEYELAQLDKKYPAYFDLPLSSYEIERHPLVEWADVINLHWISGFVDFPTFFSNIKKPIVWTMHDLNPLYGGFHHTRLREKYSESYSALESACYNIKKDTVTANPNVSFIALSSKMESIIKGHEIYQGKPVYKINNCVNPSQFRILSKAQCRQILGWPESSKILLFVNRNMNDSEKGLEELAESLLLCDKENIHLVCVGDGMAPNIGTKVKVCHYRSVQDPVWLNILYSGADFLVQPSHQEAFPLTPIEAMCCGTPVIITPVSGADDMINDNNGIIANGYTPEDISKALNLAFNRTFDSNKIREDIIAKYSPACIAKQYIRVYKNITA